MFTRRLRVPLFLSAAALALVGFAGTAKADPYGRCGGGRGYSGYGYSYGSGGRSCGSYGGYYSRRSYAYRDVDCAPRRGFGFSFQYNRGRDCYRPCRPCPPRRCGW